MWYPRGLHVRFWIPVSPERNAGPSPLGPGNEPHLRVFTVETVSGFGDNSRRECVRAAQLSATESQNRKDLTLPFPHVGLHARLLVL